MDILDLYAKEIEELQSRLTSLYEEIADKYSSKDADRVYQTIIEG